MNDRKTIRNKAAGWSAILLSVFMCVTPSTAQQTSPGQGAAVGATPGTTPMANPADQMGNMGGVNAPQQTAIDKTFVKKAMQGSLAEVELGKLTLQKTSNEQVKQFAQKMVDDHTQLNEKMRPVAMQLGVDIPTEPSKKDRSLMNKMQALFGPAYDQAYIKDMVKDRKQDLSEFQQEASNGHDAAVKDAASEGSQVIAQHLQMAQQMAKDQNIDMAKK